MRVASHLERWFDGNAPLKEKLEVIANGFWEQMVISPMLRLSDESAPEEPVHPENVVQFRARAG